jgi:hypothetical protein
LTAEEFKELKRAAGGRRPTDETKALAELYKQDVAKVVKADKTAAGFATWLKKEEKRKKQEREKAKKLAE